MDRRKLLLVAAAIVAALGAVLVFLYVRGADLRAEAEYDTRDVLKVVTLIEQGETIEDAAAAGKIALEAVPSNQVLPDALASTSTLTGQVAITNIYPGEQIISSKFGGAAESSALPIKEGDMAISVNLTDPARVAGFVNPGSEVAIFVSGTLERRQETGETASPVLPPAAAAGHRARRRVDDAGRRRPSPTRRARPRPSSCPARCSPCRCRRRRPRRCSSPPPTVSWPSAS